MAPIHGGADISSTINLVVVVVVAHNDRLLGGERAGSRRLAAISFSVERIEQASNQAQFLLKRIAIEESLFVDFVRGLWLLLLIQTRGVFPLLVLACSPSSATCLTRRLPMRSQDTVCDAYSLCS